MGKELLDFSTLGVFMFIIGGLGVIGNVLSIFVLLRKVFFSIHFNQLLT